MSENKKKLPFKIIRSDVSGGYSDTLHQQFTGGVDLVNYHKDTYGNFQDNPLQSPFTEQWVGGHQFRHININEGNDNASSRPEGWHLEFSSAQQAAVTFYSHGHLNSPPAYLTRDGLAKRPVNIRNIQGANSPIGNFFHNYEVVQTSGRRITNNLIVDGFIAGG